MSKSPSQRDDKTLTIPTYSSIADFCDDMESCLRKEIAFLKTKGGKRIKIFDGKRVDVKNGRYIYSFVSDSALNIPDNTLVTLWSSSLDNDPAVVVNSEDFTIIIETEAYLGDVVPEIEFSVELWRLLSALKANRFQENDRYRSRRRLQDESETTDHVRLGTSGNR